MSNGKLATKPPVSNKKPETGTKGTEFPIVVELDDPIETGSSTITEIKIRRKPRGGDLWDIPVGDINVGDAMKIVSKVSGVAPPILELLSLNDTVKVVEVITPFLELGS